jgi:acyl-coenzyme A synthetase/AMP-(fatty) acid ligase
MRARPLYFGAPPLREEIAFGRTGTRSEENLARDAAALSARMEAAGAGRWLTHTEDSYCAAVALVAAAQTASVVVLAPNRQPDTLSRLAPGVRGVICDGELSTEAVGDLPRLDPVSSGAGADGWNWRKPDPDRPFAEFRTSGTTGEDKRIVKALRHLDDEVAALELRFGSKLPADARVFASVSHQHIYGLLFRVMWPLATGRPFQTETLLHPQEILPRMAEFPDAVLVSSPVHLKRMHASGDLRSVEPVCSAVFSSGGPLDADVAHGVAEVLGESPFEILGSTETGGVAVRQRSASGEVWSALPEVEIEDEPQTGRLVVNSPFSSEGEPVESRRRRFTMGDRVELNADGTFLLLGRADRIVKIGEKRLSLPAMEQDLAAHPRVREAALLVLERGADARVHAVVSLDEVGRAQLQAGGRREAGRELTEHLAKRWDRILLPRVWRYVDELPRDAQGKLPVRRLQALFELQRRDPIVLDEQRESDAITRRLEVPDDLAFLAGHFDAFPVVAGVVQLRWVVEAAQALLGQAVRPSALLAVKFPEPLLPAQRVTLEARLGAAGDVIRFTLRDGERVFASGRFQVDLDAGEGVP